MKRSIFFLPPARAGAWGPGGDVEDPPEPKDSGRPVPFAHVPDVAADVDVRGEARQALLGTFHLRVLEDRQEDEILPDDRLQFLVNRQALLGLERRGALGKELVNLRVP